MHDVYLLLVHIFAQSNNNIHREGLCNKPIYFMYAIITNGLEERARMYLLSIPQDCAVFLLF